MMFGIASFRSRQQVFAFESMLRRAGLAAEVVSTPREVALGCGLSVKFDLSQSQRVMDIYRQSRLQNLIGFYQVQPRPGARSSITAIRM